MNNTNKKISNIDIEEIKLKTDIIAGLTSVCVIYLDSTEEDDQLKGALECLMAEAFRLQDKCNSLYYTD